MIVENPDIETPIAYTFPYRRYQKAFPTIVVTLREPSVATITKPISIYPRGGIAAPEFELSKKYPTVGYLTEANKHNNNTNNT